MTTEGLISPQGLVSHGKKVELPTTTRHPSLGDRTSAGGTAANGGTSPADSGAYSAPAIPRRELVTLAAYLRTGSHAQAADALGISESTSRQRVSQLIGRTGARNAAQAVWALRRELEAEG